MIGGGGQTVTGVAPAFTPDASQSFTLPITAAQAPSGGGGGNHKSSNTTPTNRPTEGGGSGGGGGAGGGSPFVGNVPPASGPDSPLTQAAPTTPVSPPVEVAGVTVVGPPLETVEVAGVTVGPASLAPYALIQATIDPAFGGSLTSVDGGTTLNVAAGAADTLTITLMLLPPTADGSLPLGNLQVGTQMYALTVTDSGGNVVTLFDPQLQLVVNPTPDALAAAGGDLSQIAVAVLDPDAGTFVGLDATIVEDGSVSFLVVGLTPVPAQLMAASEPELTPDPLVMADDAEPLP